MAKLQREKCREPFGHPAEGARPGGLRKSYMAPLSWVFKAYLRARFSGLGQAIGRQELRAQ